MASKIKKPRHRMNVEIDVGDFGRHCVSYSMDGRFCAVYPSNEQWRAVLSTAASRKIVEAVKMQQKLERDPVLLFQRTIEDNTLAPTDMSP